MGIFDFLKKDSTEEPINEIHDKTLGKLLWSEDDESWIGELSEIEFSLAYDKTSTPPEKTISFAKKCLTDKEWLPSIFSKIIKKAKEQYKEDHYNEIENLKIQSVNFYLHRKHPNGVMLLVQMKCDTPDHFWAADFEDNQLKGVGYDT